MAGHITRYDTMPIPPVEAQTEWFDAGALRFGVEYRWPEWRERQWYVSADTRWKLIYNYHQTPSSSEERQWSWNLQVGRAVPPGTTGTPLKQYFVQVYHGVNPYGQLRAQKSWWSAGIGFVFGL